MAKSLRKGSFASKMYKTGVKRGMYVGSGIAKKVSRRNFKNGQTGRSAGAGQASSSIKKAVMRGGKRK